GSPASARSPLTRTASGVGSSAMTAATAAASARSGASSARRIWGSLSWASIWPKFYSVLELEPARRRPRAVVRAHAPPHTGGGQAARRVLRCGHGRSAGERVRERLRVVDLDRVFGRAGHVAPVEAHGRTR